jgi:hypothetical protein
MPPPLRCPTCDRALQLRDEHRGALVQCPLCGTTFQAPAPVEPPMMVPPAPSLDPYRPRSAAPRNPTSPLEIPPALAAGSLSEQDRTQLTNAAKALRLMAVLYGMPLVCCFGIAGFSVSPILVLLLCIRLPAAILAWRASQRLRALRDAPGCRVAIGYLCFTVVVNLVETAMLGTQLHGHRHFGSDDLAPALLPFAIAAASVLLGTMTIFRTLAVLDNPRIKPFFR